MDSNNRYRFLVQYLAALSVSLASLSRGSAGAWPGPVIPKLLHNETSIILNENEVAWIVAMTPPGIVAGNIISSSVSDRLGRRNTILLSALPNILGTVLIVFGNKAWYLYVTRFFWGVGIGLTVTSTSMYISEIANKEIRGSLTLYSRITFHLGSLIIMSIGTFVTYEVLNYILLVLPVCYFLSCLWIPESPYFLIKEGKNYTARKALKKLKSMNEEGACWGPTHDLERELETIQNQVKSEMKYDTSVKELFTGKQYRRALLIGMGLKLAQILSGSTIMSQYIGLIMQESEANMPLSIVLIAYGALRFLSSISSAFVVDKVTRRSMYIFSYLVAFMLYMTVAIYFFLEDVVAMDRELLRTFGFVPFVCLLSINVLSNIGFNALTFVTVTEIFPMNIKAVALTTINIFSGVLNFTATLTFSFAKQSSGVYVCFMSFGLSCFCAALFVYFFLPETRGKSLKEIQVELQGEYWDKE